MIVMVIIRVKIVYINVLIMMLKMMKLIVKIMVKIKVKMRVKIKFISVLMRLVSITPGHVKLDWLPPPKVDRVNDNPAHYQH